MNHLKNSIIAVYGHFFACFSLVAVSFKPGSRGVGLKLPVTRGTVLNRKQKENKKQLI